MEKSNIFFKWWDLSLDSILNCFTRYKYIVIQKDSWINIHEWFGCNFPTWNTRNVWRAWRRTPLWRHKYMLWRHHNDTLSWVDVVYLRYSYIFFCCFEELSGFKKNTNGYPNKVWVKSETSVSGFSPPPWTSWWVNSRQFRNVLWTQDAEYLSWSYILQPPPVIDIDLRKKNRCADRWVTYLQCGRHPDGWEWIISSFKL